MTKSKLEIRGLLSVISKLLFHGGKSGQNPEAGVDGKAMGSAAYQLIPHCLLLGVFVWLVLGFCLFGWFGFLFVFGFWFFCFVLFCFLVFWGGFLFLFLFFFFETGSLYVALTTLKLAL